MKRGDGGLLQLLTIRELTDICVRQVSRRKIPGNLQSCMVGAFRVQHDTIRILESVWRTSSHGMERELQRLRPQWIALDHHYARTHGLSR